MNLFSRFQRFSAAQAPLTHLTKFDDVLNPNMRALRLAMNASELLLSMGVSANSTVSQALDVTDAYCKSPVHVDITYNTIFLSQLRGVDKEPLTLVRPVPMRDINYTILRRVQLLIRDIRKGDLSLESAERQLEEIEKSHDAYPWWLVMFGNGAVIAGVSLMFTSSWRVILTTFLVGILVDRLIYLLTKRAVAPFFRQIAAALFVTLTAAFINFLASKGADFFASMNPTLLVVGSIIMLVAGLAVVGAIQDAIEEYYVTANARLARVLLQTAGIVIGIVIGLYVARKMGIGIAISPNPLSLNTIPMQVIGAAVATAGYAVATHTYKHSIIWIGIIGAMSMAILYTVHHEYGLSIVVASGVAAAGVGFTSALMSRIWRTPSVGIVAAGIIPLVPGLMLYTGLMQLINYPPGDPLFYKALGTLFSVVTTGLSIAAGATFGSLIGRPLHQTLAANRNILPFNSLLHRQLSPHRKHRLALLALRPSAFFNRSKSAGDSQHTGES